MDLRRKPHHRHPGILAPDHPRRAGVILLSGKDDAKIADTDNRLDDAEPQSGGVECIALLDMRFEIADMPAGLDLFAPAPGKSGLGQSRAQRFAGVATFDLVDLVLVKGADIRAASEIAAVMALLVGPGGDLDGKPGAIGVGGEGAGKF